jgi:hypothetical protein
VRPAIQLGVHYTVASKTKLSLAGYPTSEKSAGHSTPRRPPARRRPRAPLPARAPGVQLPEFRAAAHSTNYRRPGLWGCAKPRRMAAGGEHSSRIRCVVRLVAPAPRRRSSRFRGSDCQSRCIPGSTLWLLCATRFERSRQRQTVKRSAVRTRFSTQAASGCQQCRKQAVQSHRGDQEAV